MQPGDRGHPVIYDGAGFRTEAVRGSGNRSRWAA